MDEHEPASLCALLDMCATYVTPPELDLIRRAYDLAAGAHHGVTRLSGEPFIEHPLAVARILAGLAMDAAGIAAALLHDVVEDTSCTLEEIERGFGPEVAAIVDGVTKFELVARRPEDASPDAAPPRRPTPEQRTREHQETVRKLLVAMLRDPRVVLLKLADRLHNMRTLGSMAPERRAAKAHETIEIYVPLAGGIGMQIVKAELEDLAFLHLQPDEFERVVRAIAREATAHAGWARRVCAHVRDRLAAQGISAAVNWRVKRPYRAHVETRQSGMGVADLHDLFAFRVLVESDLECYRALGCIHQIWHPMEDRIRDYIATPKVNGYRSLHTAVYGLDERRLQFHIRTHRMHRQVQHGVAAHWLERAARGQPADSAVRLALEDLPGWVAQLDYWHRELRLTAAEFVDALVRELFEDQVFAFTPKGDVVDLPRDSTTLDFAYRIHTALGDHCAGARVQAAGPGGAPVVRVVPVGYRIQSGDVMTVLTQPAVAVRPEWLDLVRTRGARERVLRALRALASEQGEAARPEPSAESEPQLVQPILHPSGEPAVLDLARCCYPCPDDAIVGLAGRGQRVIVHRACCRTLRRAIARRQRLGRPGATLPLDWRSVPDMAFRMAISVHGQDHRGLMFELASCMRTLGLNLTATYATAIQDRHKAVVTLICEFPWTGRPEDTLRRLRAIPGVTRVERDLTLGCADPGVEA